MSSEYTSGFEYPRVLNIPEFWIYQGSEYALGSKYAKVLNRQGFEYAKVNVKQGCDMPEYAKIIPEYVWFSLNMSEYAWICVNMPKSV